MAIATSAGALMFPTESSLDGRVFGGTWKVGVVSFPPFLGAVEAFELIVSGTGKRSGSVRLRVSGDTVAEHMARCLAEPSITAGFEAMLRGKQDEVRQNVDQAGSGCVVVLMASTLVLGSLVALASALR
jgi:hypothetical protein